MSIQSCKFRLAPFALVACAALLAPAASAQAAPSAAAKLSAVAHAAPTRRVAAIVQFKPQLGERQARALARAHHARVTARLPFIHALSLRLPAHEAHGLARTRGVRNVTLNSRVKPQSVSGWNLESTYPKTVNADRLWTGYGATYTGKGVGVAVIDTGVAGTSPDFRAADGSSRVVANAVTNPAAVTAGDTYGHGTHVAGIIAGNGENRPYGDPLRGEYLGIAPEASLIAVKAADDTGRATLLDVISALQFVVEHKAQYNIRVVNLSLSSDTPQSYKSDPLDAAVESAWLHGIVVVAAAGNRGTAADAVQYAPGNDPYAITVGALDEHADRYQLNDTVAPYSSTGVTQDGYAKPDVLAPGTRIVAPLAAGSAFSTLCPACIVGGAYIRASGTSMAAPVVAGTAALMLQAHPDWSPDQVKAALVGTGRTLTGVTGAEIAADRAVGSRLLTPANRGLTPSPLIDAVSGDIDYTKSSWSKSSWSQSSWNTAGGTKVLTWTCTCGPANQAVNPTQSNWSKSTWSQSTWSGTLEP